MNHAACDCRFNRHWDPAKPVGKPRAKSGICDPKRQAHGIKRRMSPSAELQTTSDSDQEASSVEPSRGRSRHCQRQASAGHSHSHAPSTPSRKKVFCDADAAGQDGTSAGTAPPAVRVRKVDLRSKTQHDKSQQNAARLHIVISTTKTTVDTGNHGLSGSKAPEFSPQCHGGPLEWNSRQGIVHWNKLREARSNSDVKGTPSVNVILDFLRKRQGPGGEPILSWFGKPEKRKGMGLGCEPHDTWYRLPWLAHIGKCHTGWTRAWHGSKIEALYATACCGRLKESTDHSVDGKGGRTLGDAPGVYVHGDPTAGKAAGSYSRWSPLCGDGHYWLARWEVRVNRHDKITPQGRTDQWVQPAHAVQLVALWVCGRSAEQMEYGDEMALKWDPQMEANPFWK